MNPTYHKVLLVEDEATLRGIMARNLSARGHEVAEAGCVGEALDRLNEEQPDLLLLDINLPDRTGWDLLQHLRAKDNQVPVVIVTAVRMNPTRLAEFKPLACLPKPFPLEAMTGGVTGERTEEESARRVYSPGELAGTI